MKVKLIYSLILLTVGIYSIPRQYACAPNAAAYALRMLGVEADAVDIAKASYTCELKGTYLFLLSRALHNLYDVNCTAITNISDLTCPAIIDTGGHCIAVIGFTDKSVIIFDPDFGRMNITREKLKEIWHSAILIEEI